VWNDINTGHLAWSEDAGGNIWIRMVSGWGYCQNDRWAKINVLILTCHFKIKVEVIVSLAMVFCGCWHELSAIGCFEIGMITNTECVILVVSSDYECLVGLAWCKAISVVGFNTTIILLNCIAAGCNYKLLMTTYYLHWALFSL
jgi:hypothetical protein